jgi:predicted transcriptional regulator
MSKFELKLKAEKLREQGKSVSEIARTLNVSKSTVSLWCRSIVLNETQKSNLYRKMIKSSMVGRLRGAETNHKKKLNTISEAKKWAEEIYYGCANRDLLISGIALYWAEGSKSESTNRFVFVNSDPKMILVMVKWLKEIMKIENGDFMPRISINKIHRPRIDSILKFWANLLGLHIDSFGKPVFIEIDNKKVYSNHDSYHGIIRLSIRNGSAHRHRMLCLIEILNKKMSG